MLLTKQTHNRGKERATVEEEKKQEQGRYGSDENQSSEHEVWLPPLRSSFVIAKIGGCAHWKPEIRGASLIGLLCGRVRLGLGLGMLGLEEAKTCEGELGRVSLGV